jgi:arylformamidase
MEIRRLAGRTAGVVSTVVQYGVEVPAPLPPELTLAYGPHKRHRIDFWRAQGAQGPAPLIFFVHGGAWARGDKALDTGYWKQTWFPGHGFALASINYRLVPQATLEQQAEDAATALKAVIDRAEELGVDTARIVLLGHSAGAHLVSLLGTDETWLEAAGLSFAHVAGVIGNDGAAYDAPVQIAAISPDWRGAFIDAFGDEPERQRRLSPRFHAAAPNAPHFLLLHMPHRGDGGIPQMADLASALQAAGSTARIVQVDASVESGHHELNLLMGKPGHGTTLAVEAWLGEVLG